MGGGVGGPSYALCAPWRKPCNQAAWRYHRLRRRRIARDAMAKTRRKKNGNAAVYCWICVTGRSAFYLEPIQKLKSVGVPSAQAEAEAEVLSEIFEVNLKALATKEDLLATKEDLQREIGGLR